MDAIKQAVLQALEKQGLISQLKAQLRAQVFLAVEEYETTSSGSGLAAKTSVPARGALFSDANGHLAIQLVLDFLDTCNLAFTKQVFQPELGPNTPSGGRQAAATKLGLKPSSSDEPLLLTLVRAFQTGGPSGGASVASSSAPAESSSTAAVTPVPAAAAASPPAARPPLPSLGTASKSPLAPLAPLGQQPPPQKPHVPSTSEPTRTTSYTAPGPPPPAARPAASSKPAAEPSAESAYSDEAFEEEPVDEEEAVEEETAEEEEEDDDYARAMGFKSTLPARTPDLPGVHVGSTASGGLEGGDRGDNVAMGRRGRMAALDADLMAGDRSFGLSNELAGLDAGNSGGLSFSADFPPGGPSDVRASLSTSQAMLSPISEGTPKVAKLEPLRPLGGSKLSPLAPLAPLPTIGTLSSSLNSSKDDPLAGKGPKPLAPLGGPGRKSIGDIEKEKEELRRLGLLQSGDSLGNSTSEGRSRPTGNIYDAEMSVSASMDDGTWERGAGSGGGARDDRLVFGNKGLSMDLRETGLSASDRSGDIEHMGVDLAETAEEWH
ncbi:FGFR1 oncogene partner [Tetrabaena socialis]|uniref:FGFR1 oncogene partner n=1 Tax=Tetrabaena socialis TaxID=47790 RepID=A0A2J8AA81_9CHLO|nr:FGFR1 oncogene partner [Tetrabaena socialis]|eukprot:PNH09427.1 FGFR1 oncogene partner [Tetrabaena socialis]